jgi:hypothetical protein
MLYIIELLSANKYLVSFRTILQQIVHAQYVNYTLNIPYTAAPEVAVLLHCQALFENNKPLHFGKHDKPCNNWESHKEFQRLRLPPAFSLVYCSFYSLTLKMEVTCSSETLDYFRRTRISEGKL